MLPYFWVEDLFSLFANLSQSGSPPTPSLNKPFVNSISWLFFLTPANPRRGKASWLLLGGLRVAWMPSGLASEPPHSTQGSSYPRTPPDAPDPSWQIHRPWPSPLYPNKGKEDKDIIRFAAEKENSEVLQICIYPIYIFNCAGFKSGLCHLLTGGFKGQPA